jgi:hypothetical protein
MIATTAHEDRPPSGLIEPVRTPNSNARPWLLAAGAVVGWLVIVLAGRTWAVRLMDQGVKIVLFTPPVLGGQRTEVPVALLLPIAVATTIVFVLPRAVERARWTMVVALSTVAAVGWWLALALVDGLGGLTRGLYWQADYTDGASRAATDPSAFLHSYVPDLASHPIALRGHPPGFVLLFGLLDRLGLPGPGWAAFAVLLIGASGVGAVLVAVRAGAGESTARRAAPFVVLAPAAIWIATSTDALTMGSAAWVVALLVLAGLRRDTSGDALALGAGLLAAFVALQSYGLVLLALPILLLAVAQRRVRPALISGVVAVVVTLSLSFAGYSWFDGLFATMHEYRTLDLDRPYLPFLVINLAAWSLALGPATIAGMATARDRRLWLLVGGGVLAAAAANVSGLSNGEVERIWLPFTIWVLPAGAALWTSRRAVRGWLALQALVAVSLTALIATNW